MLSSSPFLFLVTTSTHLFMRLLTCSSPWIPSTSKPVTPCLPPSALAMPHCHGQAGSRGGHGQVSGPAGSWQYRRPRGLAPARVSLPSKSHVAPPNPHVATTWLSRQNHVRKFPCPSYTWTCVITRYTLNYTLHITCNTHCEVNYLLVLLYLFWMNWSYM